MALKVRERLLYAYLRYVVRPRITDQLPDSKQVKRVLIISNTALGDSLMSLPALYSLRLAYPHAQLLWVGHPAYASLFAACPWFDVWVSYAGRWRGWWRTIRQLRAYGVIDVAAILHSNEPQATPLAVLAGARYVVKLPNTSNFAFLLANAKPRQDWDAFTHGIDQRLAVAQLAGGVAVMPRLDLSFPTMAKKEAAAWCATHGITSETPFLMFQLGASTRSRRWPRASFVALAQQLLEKYPQLHIVASGSPNEHDLISPFIQSVASPRCHNSAGALSLPAVAALLARANGLVSGDTGTLHLAIAVHTASIGLFAVSQARRSGAIQDLNRHWVIQKGRTCTPCLSKRCGYLEPPCMAAIDVSEVLAACEALLAGEAAWQSGF